LDDGTGEEESESGLNEEVNRGMTGRIACVNSTITDQDQIMAVYWNLNVCIHLLIEEVLLFK
jgi:hypothetical protein